MAPVDKTGDLKAVRIAPRRPGSGSANERHSAARTGRTAHHLISYIPANLALRYASQEIPQRPSEPSCESFPAAIGFIDVSGFTALSE